MSREHTGPSPRVIRTRKSLNTTRRLIPGAHEIPISLIVFIRAARDRDSAHGSAHSLINDPSPRAPPPHRLQRRLQRRLQKCLQRCLRPPKRPPRRWAECVKHHKDQRRLSARSRPRRLRAREPSMSWEIVGDRGWADHVVGVLRPIGFEFRHLVWFVISLESSGQSGFE